MNDKCCFFSETTVLRCSAIFLSYRMLSFQRQTEKGKKKLAPIDNRYLLSPTHLLVYTVAKEQFRSTSFMGGMEEKKGNAYVT